MLLMLDKTPQEIFAFLAATGTDIATLSCTEVRTILESLSRQGVTWQNWNDCPQYNQFMRRFMQLLEDRQDPESFTLHNVSNVIFYFSRMGARWNDFTPRMRDLILDRMDEIAYGMYNHDPDLNHRLGHMLQSLARYGVQWTDINVKTRNKILQMDLFTRFDNPENYNLLAFAMWALAMMDANVTEDLLNAFFNVAADKVEKIVENRDNVSHIHRIYTTYYIFKTKYPEYNLTFAKLAFCERYIARKHDSEIMQSQRKFAEIAMQQLENCEVALEVPVCGFVVDVLVKYNHMNIIVEMDGPLHQTPHRIALDRLRDRIHLENRFTVIRFAVENMETRIAQHLYAIIEGIKSKNFTFPGLDNLKAMLPGDRVHAELKGMQQVKRCDSRRRDSLSYKAILQAETVPEESKADEQDLIAPITARSDLSPTPAITTLGELHHLRRNTVQRDSTFMLKVSVFIEQNLASMNLNEFALLIEMIAEMEASYLINDNILEHFAAVVWEHYTCNHQSFMQMLSICKNLARAEWLWREYSPYEIKSHGNIFSKLGKLIVFRMEEFLPHMNLYAIDELLSTMSSASININHITEHTRDAIIKGLTRAAWQIDIDPLPLVSRSLVNLVRLDVSWRYLGDHLAHAILSLMEDFMPYAVPVSQRINTVANLLWSFAVMDAPVSADILQRLLDVITNSEFYGSNFAFDLQRICTAYYYFNGTCPEYNLELPRLKTYEYHVLKKMATPFSECEQEVLQALDPAVAQVAKKQLICGYPVNISLYYYGPTVVQIIDKMHNVVHPEVVSAYFDRVMLSNGYNIVKISPKELMQNLVPFMTKNFHSVWIDNRLYVVFPGGTFHQRMQDIPYSRKVDHGSVVKYGDINKKLRNMQDEGNLLKNARGLCDFVNLYASDLTMNGVDKILATIRRQQISTDLLPRALFYRAAELLEQNLVTSAECIKFLELLYALKITMTSLHTYKLAAPSVRLQTLGDLLTLRVSEITGKLQRRAYTLIEQITPKSESHLNPDAPVWTPSGK